MAIPQTDRSSPVFVVKIGSGSERLDVSKLVTSFSYEDNESKADKLMLSVDNEDLSNFDDPIWQKGNRIQCSWGYSGAMAPQREVIIQSVKGFSILKIVAHAKSQTMNKKAVTRCFENKTRSEIVELIAKENGFSRKKQHIENTKEVIPISNQAALTDAQFIKRLAHFEGFEFFVDFDGLHFHRRRLGQKPIREVVYYRGRGEVLSMR